MPSVVDWVCTGIKCWRPCWHHLMVWLPFDSALPSAQVLVTAGDGYFVACRFFLFLCYTFLVNQQVSTGQAAMTLQEAAPSFPHHTLNAWRLCLQAITIFRAIAAVGRWGMVSAAAGQSTASSSGTLQMPPGLTRRFLTAWLQGGGSVQRLLLLLHWLWPALQWLPGPSK